MDSRQTGVHPKTIRKVEAARAAFLVIKGDAGGGAPNP